MADREKVMTALELCAEGCNEAGCAYFAEKEKRKPDGRCIDLLAEDALALLKERGAAQIEVEGGGYTWWHICGECRGAVDHTDKFCRHCGRVLVR